MTCGGGGGGGSGSSGRNDGGAERKGSALGFKGLEGKAVAMRG